MHAVGCMGRWAALRSAVGGGPDEPQQQLVAPDQAGRRPGRHRGADRPAGPAVGHCPELARHGDPALISEPVRGPADVNLGE
jgi:hypothetical protein